MALMTFFSGQGLAFASHCVVVNVWAWFLVFTAILFLSQVIGTYSGLSSTRDGGYTMFVTLFAPVKYGVVSA